MSSQAEDALQKIDITLQKNRKRLAEIDALLANNEQVKQAQQRVDHANTTLTPHRSKAKNLELELQTVQQKYKTSEDRLYSGVVKNPKELQDLQHEMDSLKNRIGTLEENLLEAMLLVEESTEALNHAEAALQTALRASEQQNRELVAEKKQLSQTITTLTTQREAALIGIAPENLKTYESLRPKKANQAVAVMRNCSCTLCGIEQTKFVEEAVRKGKELVMCLGCGRILIEMA
ncbi:MAG: hypothetical protein MUE54_12120 [Anaerolineae bacterium]|nr:hypothetical protein [Anaerolineae bacterium]